MLHNMSKLLSRKLCDLLRNYY